MTKSVDDLVAGIPPSKNGTACWAQALPARPKEFVEKLKAREKSGVTLLRSAILDTLQKEFGIKIGVEALTRHLKDRCHCG